MQCSIPGLNYGVSHEEKGLQNLCTILRNLLTFTEKQQKIAWVNPGKLYVGDQGWKNINSFETTMLI